MTDAEHAVGMSQLGEIDAKHSTEECPQWATSDRLAGASGVGFRVWGVGVRVTCVTRPCRRAGWRRDRRRRQACRGVSVNFRV